MPVAINMPSPVYSIYRKPSLLVHIRDEPSEAGGAGEGGDEGVQGAEMNEVIMRVLLEQGRLQAEQLVLAVAGQLQQDVNDAQDNIQRHFLGLVQVEYRSLFDFPKHCMFDSAHPMQARHRILSAGCMPYSLLVVGQWLVHSSCCLLKLFK